MSNEEQEQVLTLWAFYNIIQFSWQVPANQHPEMADYIVKMPVV